MRKNYNPCDDCKHGHSKQNQRSGMCAICEFGLLREYAIMEETRLFNGREVLLLFDERRNLYLISGELMEEIIVKLQEGGIDQE